MNQTSEAPAEDSANESTSGWSKITIPTALAAAVVIAAVYLLGSEPANPLLNPEAEASAPDSYLSEVRSWQYDAGGALSYTLHATDAAHYPHNDESLLQEPRMQHFPPEGAQWQSTSRFGKILPGGDAVELWDAVVIKRADDSLQLSSESITVYPADNAAETNAAVAIVSPDSRTSATGMHVDLNTEVIALKADVKTYYKPESKPQ